MNYLRPTNNLKLYLFKGILKVFFYIIEAFGFGGFNQMILGAQKAQKEAFESDSSDRRRRAYPVLEQFDQTWWKAFCYDFETLLTMKYI